MNDLKHADEVDDEKEAKKLAFQSVIDEADRFIDALPTKNLCSYCGDVATDWDHVIPHTFLSTAKYRRWDSGVIPSCHHCNAMLSNMIFESMDARLGHLARRFRVKRKKIIASPDWTEGEIREMGPNMRDSVRAFVEEKKTTMARLRYLERGSFFSWLDVYASDVAALRRGGLT